LVSFVLTRRRRPRVEDFNHETINDPQIRSLMQRITVVRSGEADAAEGYGATPPFRNLCRMKFVFESGNPLEIFVERPRGTYPDLPSDDTIFEKFHDQAELLYSRDHADRIIDVVMNLERLDNVSKLTSLLFRSTAM
jgi:2-methylcitrate dehydratase